MTKLISYLLPVLIAITFLHDFHTKKLYEFKSETSEGVAALLFFHDQLVDTISSDNLQITKNSAVYIEFKKYNHESPYDWDEVYGTEGNYRVFHNRQLLPESRLPHLEEFSSPRLTDSALVYWGFINGKVFGFHTDLDTFKSDSILIFEEVIGTDFRYAYDTPTPKKDSLFLFRTWTWKDSVIVNFNRLTKTKLN